MVLAAVVARVVAGDVTFPLLAVIVVAAAAVGLLLAPRVNTDAVAPVTTLPWLAALALILAANLVVAGEVARLLGVARLHGVVAAAALALAVVAVPFGERGWRFAAPIGAAIVLVPLALVMASGGAPWTVWRDVASRPALTFAATSPWVTHGRALVNGARLTFDEPHRVIAATAATWRVIERDPARVVVREWRLGAGDALTVRPGDQLAVDPGARVRFEAGRRVPGVPPSGMAWAAGRHPARETIVALAGVTIALVVGGLALAPAAPVAGAAGISVPLLALVFVVGATLWGLYGLAIAPEVSLVPGALAPVLEVLQRAQTPAWRATLIGGVTIGLAVLFVGTVVAWRLRVAAALQRHGGSRSVVIGGTAALVVVATVVAAREGDAWQLFTWGLGLAAAAVVAPRLASAGPRGELAGVIVGTLAFVAACLAGLPPALIAPPLAWLAARVARTIQ